MNIKSRKARWICGILAVGFIAVGFAVFNSRERKHIAYAKKLGCTVRQKPLFTWRVYEFLPQQLHPFIAVGSVYLVEFPPNSQAIDADAEPILGYFPELEDLNLSGTRITDEILKSVLSHQKLRCIYLDDTSVTDEGVKLLSQSTCLTQIYLNRTKISDASIVHLSQMKQLEVLNFAGTNVTDASVDILCQMPQLKYVDLQETQFSKEGLKRLRKKLHENRTFPPHPQSP